MKIIKNQNFKQYSLSNEEKGRLANFFSLLFKIDKRINGSRKKSKKRSNKKSREGIDTLCFLLTSLFFKNQQERPSDFNIWLIQLS